MFAESLISPEQFAELLCDDLELPMSTFVPAIAQSLKQQLEQYNNDLIPQDEEDRRVIVKVRGVSVKLMCVRVRVWKGKGDREGNSERIG